MRRPHRIDGTKEHSQNVSDSDYDDQPGMIVASPDHHSHYRPHEHGSDPDETDDESVIPRIRSFGDAEDLLNNYGNGSHDNSVRTYRSLFLQSPHPFVETGANNSASNATISYTGNYTLHHRSRHTTASTPLNNGTLNQNHLDEDESPRHRLLRQLPSLNSPYSFRHGGLTATSKRSWSQVQFHQGYHTCRSSWTRSYSLIRTCFLIGLGSYLILLSKSTYYLGHNQDQDPSSQWSESDGPLKLQMYYRQQKQKQYAFYFSPSASYFGKDNNRDIWYQERLVLVQNTRREQSIRSHQRKLRTSLLSSLSYDEDPAATLGWHRVLSLNESRPYQKWQDMVQKDNPHEEETVTNTATVDQLCGYHAQNSSLSHPQFYSSNSALNSDSRVLITGILNPIGFSLALYLKEKCGVQLIAGVDPMYPNTVYNRLLLQERIKLLTTNIPKLITPIFVPFVGLDLKSKSSTSSIVTDAPGQAEMNWMEGFEPTHIIHLASYSLEAMYNDALVDPKWKNTQSPYVAEERSSPASSREGEAYLVKDPLLYPIRSSMAAIEQLLQSVVSVPKNERPQFVYVKQASLRAYPNSVVGALTTSKTFSPTRSSYVTSFLKQVDEMLVDTYHAHHAFEVPSIGVALPNGVYGPWGLDGDVLNDVISRPIKVLRWMEKGNNRTNASLKSTIQSALPADVSPASRYDFLYVDDAVDALVAALQFHTEQPVSVSIKPKDSSTIASFVSAVRSFLEPSHTSSSLPHNPFSGETLLDHNDTGSHAETIGLDGLNLASVMIPRSKTTLKNGLLRSLAWYLDYTSPFGSDDGETGDAFLVRHGQDVCSHDDVTCHKSFSYLPCNSECNIHQNCMKSVFDPVLDLVHNVSDGCDVVLITQSLGYDVDDMALHAEYMDDKDLDDDELLVCNFAFVPRESKLVASVSDKVPNDQLSRFGIKPDAKDASSKAMKERKLNGLNGRLLYRGWILIWVPNGTVPLNPADQSLLKLSPSKFFHPGVKYGIFVEENFSVSPNLEDVLFLVDEMKRRSLPDRTVKKEEKVETVHGVISKKVKYRIPKEPARRAAILFAPLRYPNIDDQVSNQYRSGNRKLSIYDAAKFMRFEVGYELDEKEPASLRRQREYYERVPSYINKNTEWRSNFEPWYRFSMRHWVRSRWVVHDFALEDSRLLRCDWYLEHVQWGNDLDQLSFANVVATRELKRRMSHREPDDHIKTFIEAHPELHDLTDSYEWHALETDVNKLHQDPVVWDSQVVEQTQVGIDSQGTVTEATDVEESEMPLFIRIMSERVMATSRKLWTRARRNGFKSKHTQR